jgi:parallel beta-helix repeat protein
MLNSNNNTINNVELTANKNGMLLQNSSNNLLNQIKVFDNYEN